MDAQKASARVAIRAQSAFLSHGNEPTAVSDGCSIQINRGTQRRSAHRNLFDADYTGADVQRKLPGPLQWASIAFAAIPRTCYNPLTVKLLTIPPGPQTNKPTPPAGRGVGSLMVMEAVPQTSDKVEP